MGIPFNKNEWIERARRRYLAVDKPDCDLSLGLFKYSEDVRCIEGLVQVISWCTKQKITVDFISRNGGEYFAEDRKITVCKNTSPQHQLHVLLHECGHHLIGKPNPDQRFGMGYDNDEAAQRNTIHHKIDILEEEFEAWHRGWRLGIRLGALKQFDKPAFDKNRTRMLRQYIDWASRSWKKTNTSGIRR